MKKKIFIFSLVAILILGLTAGCNGTKENVSVEAKKIINTICNCPNQELYSLETFTIIGENVNSKDQRSSEEINANWEKELGECFEEGKLQEFLSTGPATYYFSIAEIEDVEITVKNIELLENGEVIEKVKVILQNGDVEEEIIFVFQHEESGLISEVMIE